MGRGDHYELKTEAQLTSRRVIFLNRKPFLAVPKKMPDQPPQAHLPSEAASAGAESEQLPLLDRRGLSSLPQSPPFPIVLHQALSLLWAWTLCKLEFVFPVVGAGLEKAGLVTTGVAGRGRRFRGETKEVAPPEEAGKQGMREGPYGAYRESPAEAEGMLKLSSCSFPL